jgi:hypothetical protein
LRFTTRGLRIAFLFGLAAVAASAAFRAVGRPYGILLMSSMGIVAAFGLVHGARELQAALLPSFVRRRLAGLPPSRPDAPFDVRAASWADRLRAFDRLLSVRGGDGDDEPPEDLAAAARSLMGEMADAYPLADAAQRRRMRALLSAAPRFADAVDVPRIEPSADLRRRLVRYSLVDQQGDWRDAVLELDDILRSGAPAGLDVSAVLRDVAAMSSDESVDPSRSTRQTLLAAAEERNRERTG